jgi:hypothetical protein
MSSIFTHTGGEDPDELSVLAFDEHRTAPVLLHQRNDIDQHVVCSDTHRLAGLDVADWRLRELV